MGQTLTLIPPLLHLRLQFRYLCFTAGERDREGSPFLFQSQKFVLVSFGQTFRIVQGFFQILDRVFGPLGLKGTQLQIFVPETHQFVLEFGIQFTDPFSNARNRRGLHGALCVVLDASLQFIHVFFLQNHIVIQMFILGVLVLAVTFHATQVVLTFDQFDFGFNRPDAILFDLPFDRLQLLKFVFQTNQVIHRLTVCFLFFP